MTNRQERTIAANAIAQKLRTNVNDRDIVRVPSDEPSINLYATHKKGKIVLCKIAYDGSTTIKTADW